MNAPDRPISAGEIEAGPGVVGLFPAESFFNVWVDVDLPLLGTLRNTEALVVENSLAVDVHDVVTNSPDSAYVAPADRDSLSIGIDHALAVGANDPCTAILELSRLFGRVDGLDTPTDWVTDPVVRGVFASRIDGLEAQFQTQANQEGGCHPTAVEPAPTPKDIGIVSIVPNPSHRAATVGHAIPRRDHVTLAIYDLGGRLVNRLVDADITAGVYWVVWGWNRRPRPSRDERDVLRPADGGRGHPDEAAGDGQVIGADRRRGLGRTRGHLERGGYLVLGAPRWRTSGRSATLPRLQASKLSPRPRV